MCTYVGAGPSVALSLIVVTLPLGLLPLAAGVVAWRRGGRSWPALAALACGMGYVVALALRPSAEAPRVDERWTNMREALVEPVFPGLLALAGLVWLAATAWPARPVRGVALAAVAATFAATLLYTFSFPLSGNPCPELMRPPTP